MAATENIMVYAEQLLAADQSLDNIRFVKTAIASGVPCTFPEAQVHVDAILEKLAAVTTKAEASVASAPALSEPVVSEPEWLKSYLESSGGLASADAIAAAAAERSYSTSTLHRAKQQLKLKQGWVGRESHWALPNVEIPAPVLKEPSQTEESSS